MRGPISLEHGNSMEIYKNLVLFVLATVAAIFLIGLSLASFGLRSPVSALVVNWLVVCWIASGSLVIRFSLPSTYYDPRPFERAGQVYERAGIRLFKKLLRRGPLRILSPKLRFPKQVTIEALRDLENEMRKAETIHAVVFLLMLLMAGCTAARGWPDGVTWILLFNILINGYPIMLQRYNRIKLQELMRKPSA